MKKLTFAYREEPRGELFAERKRRRKLGEVYSNKIVVGSEKYSIPGWRLNAMGWEGDDFVLDYRKIGYAENYFSSTFGQRSWV
jgi:hypothetical protein